MPTRFPNALAMIDAALLRVLLPCVLALVALCGAPAWAESFGGPASHHMKVELVAESDHPAPGKPLSLAIVMTPQPGWHGYWLNPGEAGFAPDFKWTLPGGYERISVAFPVPEKLVLSGLVNHVFTGEHALLVTTKSAPSKAVGTPIHVALKTNYLVCSDQICVPESAEATLDLATGDGHVDPATAAKFDQFRAALPKPLGADATYQIDKDHIRFSIPYPAGAALNDPWLFAATEHAVKSAGQQKVTRQGDALIIDAVPLDGASALKAVDAVLSTGGHRGLLIHATAGIVAPAGADTSFLAILTALGGALLGGLILNLMPCVFPVIGLKAISLARGGGDEREVRRDALAYAAGVILVCVALGGLMLGLRAAGHAVGWAFQLQDPKVILLLLLLVTAITANLGGLFELGSVNAGDSLTRQKGLAGSFWTGALAAFVATPCTGPFMAAALGAALVLPTFVALMIFAGLGLGLALPFLLLGYVPALRTRLPKPGAWMRRFQQIMAIPMGLTALGLLWLLWRQAGADGLLIGLAVAGLALLALWLVGRNQHEGRAVGLRNLIQLLVPAAVGVALLAQIAPPAGGAQVEAGLLHAEPFSEARLAALQAAHRPVFVYFTADWCLTCKVNEKAAIETQAVADAFKAHNTAVLVGDWTNGDAAISHFLAAHQRSGVPYYLYYPANGTAPQELPQVLTSGLMVGLN